MTVPRLDRPLVLEAPQRVADGAGGFVEVWQPLGTLWAGVETRTGRERIEARAPVSAMRYRITVRGALVGSPQRPQPQQRFRDGPRVYVIEAVAEADRQGRYLICFADEEVAV